MIGIRVEAVFGELPALETQRLILRRLVPEDAADIFAYASDEEVALYTTWSPHRSLDDSQSFVAMTLQLYATGQVASWGMLLKESGRIIGTCGYADWRTRHARAEIGYALSRQYWGRGLMTEAVQSVLAFGFREMRLNRIEARCLTENIGSARVMEKAGMRFEGLLREQSYIKERFVDLKLYSILRREWEAQRQSEQGTTDATAY